MGKIKINYIITSDDNISSEEVIGNINSNIISFKEKDNTYVDVDIKNNELIRENEDLLLKFSFNKSKGTILIKDLNRVIELNLTIKKILNKNNKYFVQYLIDEDDFKYELEYEEV